MTQEARLRHLRHRELDGLARGRLRRLAQDLGIGVVAYPGKPDEFTFTAANATNEITVTGQDDLTGRVAVYADAAGALPTGLASGTLYWLRDTGLNLYTLHPTAADAAANTNIVAFSDDGSGTLTVISFDV